MSIERIKDNGIYLSSMQKTFPDKAWFLNHLYFYEPKFIVDFGCADGSFGKYLKSVYPEKFTYLGVESNPEFIDKIVENGGIHFKSLDEVKRYPKFDPYSTLLVLNSVVHEIYSYSDIDKFWEEVENLHAKQIAFRDMYVGNCGRYSNAVENNIEDAVKGTSIEAHYHDFISRWGRLKDGYKAVHFLLKYFYDENWEREVKENYVPFTYRDIHMGFRKARYRIHYEKFYALPYLISRWENDFDCGRHLALKSFIEDVTTHLKLLAIRED